MSKKRANDLLGEDSPYLLQHAYNPVAWKPWSEKALKEATEQGKLLLISIGYAACHWCHVMEHESFEDEAVAKVMNASFINIKVDREERPDIDQIYMDALQMMTGRGGWPLNIVALPDGRPFWGTTYLPAEEWKQTLEKLQLLWEQQPDKVEEYADKLTRGVRAINLLEIPDESENASLEKLHQAVNSWIAHIDEENGGFKGAPKFMMPVNCDFLLHYGHCTDNAVILDHLHFTLEKMAYGGLYDQIGGGFSRYSVDERWHIPHFEKMLYDNAQLIGLYAKAYAQKPKALYQQVIAETVKFLQRELMDENFGFYSSLDADSLDSEGNLVEGAYYRWTIEEIKDIVREDFPLVEAYYNINQTGIWEEHYYVPIRTSTDQEVAKKFRISEERLIEKIAAIRKSMMEKRAQRPRPRLDNKIICSWNSLLISGLFDAARYLKNQDYSRLALKTLHFVDNHLRKGSMVYHTTNGIEGFLEDYAGLLQNYLDAYLATFNEDWLYQARKLFDIIVQKFYDPNSKLFYFTASDNEPLIRRTIETGDNVIPSSNSVLLQALFTLNHYFPRDIYEGYLKAMSRHIPAMVDRPYGYANWLHQVLWENLQFNEIVVTGKDYKNTASDILSRFLPNSITAAGNGKSSLLLLENRQTEDPIKIYICEAGACQLPVNNINDALRQLNV